MTAWDRATARAAWAVLLTFTALSSYLNARAAAFDPAAATEQLMIHAAIQPVMLTAAAFTEMAALSTMHRAAKAVVVTVMGSVFGITLAASYAAVLNVTRAWNPHAPGWVNMALAAVPDLVMVMAGVTVLSLRMRRHGLAAAPSATPRRSRMRRLADAATARAEAVLAAPVAVEPEAAAGTLAEPAVGASADPTTAADAASAGVVAEPSRPTPRSPRRPAAKPSVEPALEPFMETARRLAEANVVRGKTPIDYARILRAKADGWSPTRIKSQLNYSHETTAKVVAAAAAADPEPAPTLAAVR